MMGVCHLTDDSDLMVLAAWATAYPHPHNVFGRSEAGDYVRRLSETEEGGWIALKTKHGLSAAIHLSRYCTARPSRHVLWRLRHPLSQGKPSIDALACLIDQACQLAARCSGDTGKFLMLLSEHEVLEAQAAMAVGFEEEGRIKDYYRLGECCVMMGRTDPSSREESL